MKKISRLIQLLPSAALEDFPNHLNGELAAGVLANWTAAWHPLLIAKCGNAPIVYGTDQTSVEHAPPTEIDNDRHDPHHREESEQGHDSDLDSNLAPDFWRDSLVFVPEISLESIADGFAAEVVGSGASLITGMADRNEILQRAFALLKLESRKTAIPSKESSPSTESVCCGDFHALGYAYLQIQLLTRKIRYSSNLDQSAFDLRLVQAARAFAENDDVECGSAISACYDMLLEEKNNYYPVKPALIDLVLTTPKTVGDRFGKELQNTHLANFLMTGESLHATEGSVLDKLKSKLDRQQATVVGGNEIELPDTLLSPETTLSQLKRGIATFKQRLDYDLGIFMRRRFGLMPALPGILEQLDFKGAMHTSLDGGIFPNGAHGTIRWAGDGVASILAKAETLLDASVPETLLDLGVTIGRQIDSTHEATCTFAHWPGRAHVLFEDLIRVAKRSSVLGEFTTLDDHFETLYDPGYASNFSTEEYAAPFLEEAINGASPAPLSRIVDYWRQYFSLKTAQGLIALWFAALLRTPNNRLQQLVDPYLQRCDQLSRRIETRTANWSHDPTHRAEIDNDLAEVTDQLLKELTETISGEEREKSETRGQKEEGWALVNPLFFSRRSNLCVTDVDLPDGFYKTKQPFVVHQIAHNQRRAVAEVSGSSVTPIAISGPASAMKKEPPVVDGEKLQNEFFVANIDRQTGALRGILFHGQRGNRAGQRLVLVDKRSAISSTMACDAFEVTASGHLGGEVKTSGRILMGAETVAHFTQVFRLRRGQRVLELELNIEPTIELRNSKTHYFAHRLAWRDEACKVFGADQFVRSEIYTPKIQSPNFVEIENLDYTLTLLPGGMAYHRRIQRRQLDTLLIVGREQQRKLRLGIGVDLKHALKSAIDFASPALGTKLNSSTTTQFFHLDSKNVLVTDARPVFGAEGEPVVFEMRIQETQRRGGEVTLFTPFKMGKVERTNFHGQSVETLHDQQGAGVNQIKLRYAAAEFFQIRIVIDPTGPGAVSK